jgi:hypothetical protein
VARHESDGHSWLADSWEITDSNTKDETVAPTVYTRGMRNTQRKGDYAVAKAISSFTRVGYDVLIPITESAPYDIAVELDGLIKRVQVKYCSSEDVDLRRIHSNSKGYVVKKTEKNAYDWLYVLTSEETEYLIKECLHGRSTIRPTENQKFA